MANHKDLVWDGGGGEGVGGESNQTPANQGWREGESASLTKTRLNGICNDACIDKGWRHISS